MKNRLSRNNSALGLGFNPSRGGAHTRQGCDIATGTPLHLSLPPSREPSPPPAVEKSPQKAAHLIRTPLPSPAIAGSEKQIPPGKIIRKQLMTALPQTTKFENTSKPKSPASEPASPHHSKGLNKTVDLIKGLIDVHLKDYPFASGALAGSIGRIRKPALTKCNYRKLLSDTSAYGNTPPEAGDQISLDQAMDSIERELGYFLRNHPKRRADLLAWLKRFFLEIENGADSDSRYGSAVMMIFSIVNGHLAENTGGGDRDALDAELARLQEDLGRRPVNDTTWGSCTHIIDCVVNKYLRGHPQGRLNLLASLEAVREELEPPASSMQKRRN